MGTGGIMLRLIILMSLVACASQAAISELSGYDVRKKNERYEIMLGPDNDLLEERDISIFKNNKLKRQKIINRTVVLTATQPAEDIEAIYKSDNLTLQLGVLRPNPDNRTGKRIIVVRIDERKKSRKTLVFESNEILGNLN